MSFAEERSRSRTRKAIRRTEYRSLPKLAEQRAVADARFGAPVYARGYLTVPPEPYRGPREFILTDESALRASGRPVAERHMYRVVRDESLTRPYGGFRVYRGSTEIGRTLSWPDLDACRRLHREYGHA